MDEYRFERISEDNLHCLIHLYKSCFGIITDLAFLRKKYATSAFGAAYIGYIAFKVDTNEIAGYYGVFPIIGELNGKKIRIAQSGDTMTHPNHQGKGLFIKLAKATYGLAQTEDISFVFGFPNKNSYPGFAKKLEWQFYNDINVYILRTGTLPFDKLAKKFKPFSLLYNLYTKNRLKSIVATTSLENSLKKQNSTFGSIIHDQNFYIYKKYYTFYTIKVNDTICVIKLDGRMWVGDIAYSDKDHYLQTVDKLIILANKLGCSSVHFSLFNGSFYDQLMQQKYPIATTTPVGYISLDKNSIGEKFAYQAIDFDTY